jgi:hypothetical protein
LGADFIKTVDTLEQNLIDIVDGRDVPRVVIIEAPSGSGKSRIVRELYDRLRTNPRFNNLSPEGDCYWPSLAEDVFIEDGINSGFQLRKELGPELHGFDRKPNTLPGFMWYSIRCDILAGKSASSVLEFVGPRLKAHSPFIANSILNGLSLPKKAEKKIKSALRIEEWSELSDAALGELVLKVFEKFELLQGIPFVAYGIDKGLELFRSIRKKIEFATKIKDGGNVQADLASAEQIYKAMIATAHQKVPLVLALEDMHLVDDELAALVASLSVPLKGRPVMIIGTNWPESATREVYEALIETLAIGQGDQKGGILKIGLNNSDLEFPKLTKKDKGKFVHEYAPRTNAATSRAIAEIYDNPFAIKLALASKFMQNRIKNGSLVVSKNELRKIPKTVEAIYRMRWMELPKEVQILLEAAASLMPHDGTSDGRLYFFMRESFLGTIAKFPEIAGAIPDASDVLELCAKKYCWLVPLPDSNGRDFQFKEWILQDVARSEMLEHWTEREIFDFRKQCALSISESLIAAVKGKGSDPREEVLNWRDTRTHRGCRLLLAINQLGKFDDLPFRAIRISNLTLGEKAHSESRMDEVLTFFKNEYFKDNNEFGIWGRNVRLWILAIRWPSNKILKELEALIEKAKKVPISERTMQALIDTKVRLLENLCREEDALVLINSHLSQRRKVFGRFSTEILNWHADKIQILFNLNKWKAAQNEATKLEALLNHTQTSVGKYHNSVILELKWRMSQTWEASNDLQKVLDLQKPDPGIEDFEEKSVRDHANAILGPIARRSGPESIVQMGLLVSKLKELGDLEGKTYGWAIFEYAELLEEYHSLGIDSSYLDEFKQASADAISFATATYASESRNYFDALNNRISQLILMGDFVAARKNLIKLEEAVLTHRNNKATKRIILKTSTYLYWMVSTRDPSSRNLQLFRESLVSVRKSRVGIKGDPHWLELYEMRLAELEYKERKLYQLAKQTFSKLDIDSNQSLFSATIHAACSGLERLGESGLAAELLSGLVETHFKKPNLTSFERVILFSQICRWCEILFYPKLAKVYADLIWKELHKIGNISPEWERRLYLQILGIYYNFHDWDSYLKCQKELLERELRIKDTYSKENIYWRKFNIEATKQFLLSPESRNLKSLQSQLRSAEKAFGINSQLYGNILYFIAQLSSTSEKIEPLDKILSATSLRSNSEGNLYLKLLAQKAYLLLYVQPHESLKLLVSVWKSSQKDRNAVLDLDETWLLIAMSSALSDCSEFTKASQMVEFAKNHAIQNGRTYSLTMLLAFLIELELDIKSDNFEQAEILGRQITAEFENRYGSYHPVSAGAHMLMVRLAVGLRDKELYKSLLAKMRVNLPKNSITESMQSELDLELSRHSNVPWNTKRQASEIR